MAISGSTTLNQRASPIAPGDGAGCDRYIEDQLDRTRFHVRITDLCTALMVLAAGVLGFLLVAAVVDHWIVALGTWGRWLAFLAILASCVYYSGVFLVPLLWRPINPVYAAHAIEQSQPTLKNSLINFLLFRSDRAGVRAAIYQALEQRAAADLSHVRVEAAVDRSRLIKIGYTLIAVLVFCAAYAMLTPKSPWQSVARVLAPWADLAPPSRVRIEEVQPGHTTVYQGATLTVSARCYDVRDDEPVMLFYSSLDGRVSHRHAEMKRQDDALTYECQLPEETDTGVQQGFVYWIEAGDVRTPTYQVRVTPTPTILVERVEYEYPAYTKLPKRIVEERGDLQAIEGTRVTVRARTNRPIASAVLEFDPALEETKAPPGQAAPPSSPDRIDMQFRNEEAWCSFFLELDEERVAPKHRSYHLRFSAAKGEHNLQPVLHRIEVIRDLPPEVEILRPASQRVEVPEDGHLKIEVRAIDPDFGLREARLRAVAGGQAVLDHVLIQDAMGKSGQVVADFDVQPRSLGLHAGDQVTYWALAEDNRCAPQTGKPAPNTAKTGDYTLVVVAPESSTPSEQPAEKPPGEEPTEAAPRPEDPPAESPPAPKTDDPSAKPPSEEPKQEDSQTGDESQPAGSGSKDQGKQQGGKSEETGGGSGSDKGSAGGKNQPGDPQAGSNTSDGSSQGDSASGTKGTGGSQAGSQGGQSQAGSEAGEPGAEGAPEEPLHDGEVFEKTLEHIKAKQGGSEKQGTQPDSLPGSKSKTRPAGDPTPDGDSSGQGTQSVLKPKPGQNQPLDGAKPQADGAGTQDTHSPDVKPGAKPGHEPTGKPEPAPQQPDQSEGPGQQQPGGPSEGGEPKGPMETRSEGEPKSPQPEEPPQPGQGDSGDSGAGQNSADKTGAGPGLKENRDRPKSDDSSASQPKPDDEPQTPSESKHQSDSKGGEGGDRSGGGEKGHGQGANQPGADSAGSNTSADEGAGASKESGSGETSGKAGGKEPADRKTGQSGTQSGPGTASRPGTPEAGGSGLPKEPGPSAAGQPKPTGPGGKHPPTDGQGVPFGGGAPGTADLTGSPPAGEVPPGEKPNVEYANKATDLVLEYLKDQQNQPDPELLEKLGWTAEDLRAFIRRWEAMKHAATEDKAAQRDLNETLRGLGLRPTRQAVRSVGTPTEARREARNIGSHSNPPPGYSDLFDAYRKGTARTGP